MNRYSISNEQNSADKRGKIRFLDKKLSDEELRKTVRRAVKNVRVPADLESKLLDLLSKQL